MQDSAIQLNRGHYLLNQLRSSGQSRLETRAQPHEGCDPEAGNHCSRLYNCLTLFMDKLVGHTKLPYISMPQPKLFFYSLKTRTHDRAF